MVAIRCALPALVFLFATSSYADDAVPKGALPRIVVPSLVQLELRIDPGQPRFSGMARIEAEVTQPTQTIWMHGRDLTITKAEVILSGGKRIAMSAQNVDVSGVLRLTTAEELAAGT